MIRFSPAEAAVAARTDIKTVHNVIDDLLPEAAGPTRSLSATDVVIVAASTALGAYLTREAKAVFVAEYKKAPRSRIIHCGVGLRLDTGEIRSSVIAGMRTVRGLRRLAVSDPGILGGTPVFRGTRIPVALIAHMVERGEPVERIREGYPALTDRQIRLAPLYVRTYPRRGRPPARPWAEEGRESGSVTRMPLKAVR